MKTTFFFLFIALFTFIGCNDDDNNKMQQQIVDGHYIGIFDRGGNTSNVEITFNNGTFEGSSQSENYPAICGGTYSFTASEIEFFNKCFFTANFDGTLILMETWSYTYNNNVLTMIKANGDKYTLTKQ